MSTSQTTTTGSSSNAVDVNSIPVPQLSQLQTRLSQELEHLTASYQRLRAAQTRFRDCIRSVRDGIAVSPTETKTKPLLIPLTTSLYVPATLSTKKPDTVLVDVGTGFYVEKSAAQAIGFYEGKVKELDGNLKDIEKAVGRKNESLGVVEDVLRQKVLAQQGGGGGGGAAAGGSSVGGQAGGGSGGM